MADVSRDGVHGQVDGTRSRGQLLLVTALSLAILFVTLALILNTAIYTENLATRSGDIGGATDAVRYQDAARDGVGGIIGYANGHNNTSHSTLRSNLSTGVEEFRNNSARLFASGDRAVEVTLNDSVDGTRIAQTNESRNFTNRSGVTSWILVQEVENTREIRFHVFSNLLDTLSLTPFRMILDGPLDTWELAVSSPTGSDVKIEVDSPSGVDTCTVSETDAWINVTEGTLADEPCEPLESFGDGIGTPYEIRFENSEDARGTYTMIVDNSTLANDVETGSNTHLFEDGAGQPFAAHAIYSANVTVVYETSRLYYNTSVRVAPGESNG